MIRRIIVRVSQTGDITVEADGFQGKGCEAATKAIEDALGEPKERIRKAEYWRHSQSRQNEQRLGNGPE